MYHDILLPVDERTDAGRIIHHVSEIAHRFDGRVQLLNVADTNRDSVTVVETEVVDALEREGEAVLEDAGATLDTLGVDYGTDVVQGNPAPTIVEYAETYDYDLVSMPTHGRGGLSRRILGSVTEKVVRLSSVPVLTTRIGGDDELRFPYERILVPVDGSDAAEDAARHGVELARTLDATVHALSVVDDTSLGPDVRSMVSERDREEAAKSALGRVASVADELGGVEVVEHVEHGDPSTVIGEAIESNDVHAVVMGTTGKSGVDRILLGSVAAKTIRSAPVPVVTVGGER